ncbi:MAG: indole-3-glycerol phosphate synthase TrpC [Myxococcales bacterium]|nr:indole-3-glycerol phosphate synthase TrpC [Myxococcales bacterium]
MTILETILAHKKQEVAERKELYPLPLLEKSIYMTTPVVSLKRYLRRDDKVGVIAEIKRRSPSKGEINAHISVERLSIGYMQAGASALSVLTDHKFFGGSSEDLKIARRFNFCPILRKDFILDEYQILEARSIGADVILLIARALPPDELKRLAAFARSLGLEVLLEVHDKQELETYWSPDIDIVGVNNRDLRDFSVSLDRSLSLVDQIPAESVKISESGLHSAQDLWMLKKAGFDGFLIGEMFMKRSQPEESCARLIREYQELAKQQG